MNIQVVCGKADHGKTKFMVDLMNEQRESGKQILFFSYDHSIQDLISYGLNNPNVQVVSLFFSDLTIRKIKKYLDLLFVDILIIDTLNSFVEKEKDYDKNERYYEQFYWELNALVKSYELEVYIGKRIPSYAVNNKHQRPTLRDVYNCEQKGTEVIGLYREDVWNVSTKQTNTVEIINLKTGEIIEKPFSFHRK